jgi:hypothetical protein
MHIRAIVTTVGALCVANLAVAQPKPEVSEYLKTRGGGAVTDSAKEPGAVYFGLTLDWVKRPPAEASILLGTHEQQIMFGLPGGKRGYPSVLRRVPRAVNAHVPFNG